MANNELLEEVMQHIELNNELWYQGDWYRLYVNGWDEAQVKALLLEDPDKPPCGSAGCFAGNACTLEGWIPVFRAPCDWADQEYWVADHVRPKGEDKGVRRPISALATELLGLDEATSGRLFEPGNSVEDLRKMVDYIKEHGGLHGYRGDESEHEYCDNCDGCLTCGDCDGWCAEGEEF